MSWPVYSERFAVNDGVADWQAYTVPPGHRAVIRSVTATRDGVSRGLTIVMVQGHTICRLSPGQDSTEVLALHLPVYAGEWMAVWCNSSGNFATISGYLLKDSTARALERSGAVELPAGDPAREP